MFAHIVTSYHSFVYILCIAYIPLCVPIFSMSVPVVTSYCQNPRGNLFSFVVGLYEMSKCMNSIQNHKKIVGNLHTKDKKILFL